MIEDNENKNTTLKDFASKPIVLVMIGVLLGNINTVVDFIVPSLEKVFVTKEEIGEIKEDVHNLKDEIADIKEDTSQIKTALTKIHAKETKN